MADSQSVSIFQALRSPQTWGVILSSAGLLTAGVCLFVQFMNMNHGTSGQLTVDSNMNTTLWPVLLSFLLLIIGGLLYLFFETTQRPFLWLFSFTFLSVILSNFALLMSLYQVQITKV